MKTNSELQSGSVISSNALFGDLIRKYNLAAEALTEEQLAEAIRQAIASGDFIQHVVTDGRQTITYIPWRESERLRRLYNDLLYAVVRKFPGESRHETALRYIREAESRTNSGPACESPNAE